MPHETSLITILVAGFVLAFIFGALAQRLKLSPLVGYLVAGIVAGPFTPGFVGDMELAPQLAEIGVILLMFGVGLHFSWRDLMAVKAIALPGAVVQITVATVLGWGLARWLGWSHGAGLVFGLSLSCASTVVLLRALEDRRLLDTRRGHIAVGWLIVEDLVCVLALVLMPALAGILDGDAAGLDALHAAMGVDHGLADVRVCTRHQPALHSWLRLGGTVAGRRGGDGGEANSNANSARASRCPSASPNCTARSPMRRHRRPLRNSRESHTSLSTDERESLPPSVHGSTARKLALTTNGFDLKTETMEIKSIHFKAQASAALANC